MPAAHIQIFETHAALYDQAADFILHAGNEALAERGRFLIALSGGGTPRPLYRKLADPPYLLAPFWRWTHFFWGDERLVPPDDGQSNYGQAQQDLLDYIPVPSGNVHRIYGEFDLPEAVTDCAKQLATVAQESQAWPRFDLIILGMGQDGHVASLFPAKTEPNYVQPVIGLSANYQGRPADRVSLTPLVLNQARRLLFLVLGQDKAKAVAATLAGERDPARWPAQRIRLTAGKATWFLDRSAAELLSQDWR